MQPRGWSFAACGIKDVIISLRTIEQGYRPTCDSSRHAIIINYYGLFKIGKSKKKYVTRLSTTTRLVEMNDDDDGSHRHPPHREEEQGHQRVLQEIRSRSTTRHDKDSQEDTFRMNSQEAVKLCEEGKRFLFQRHEYTKALECFEEAIALIPEFAAAYLHKGMALLWRGQKPPHKWILDEHNASAAHQAIEEGFDPCLSKLPTFPLACFMKATASIDCGRHEQAQAMLDATKPDAFKESNAIQASRHRLEAHKQLATLQTTDRNVPNPCSPYNKVIAELDKGLNVEKLSGPEKQFLWYDKGCVFALAGRYMEALEEFTRVKDNGPLRNFKSVNLTIQEVNHLISGEEGQFHE
eukprot:gb/GECG01001406.1/.p1 GENE.gb/GECG01001406.1/~~gb/GECG01001406.1/.p1  ORF type:complete len:352 (+),score=36.69 gb/GECG01001406.1/:1-1056(+)